MSKQLVITSHALSRIKERTNIKIDNKTELYKYIKYCYKKGRDINLKNEKELAWSLTLISQLKDEDSILKINLGVCFVFKEQDNKVKLITVLPFNLDSPQKMFQDRRQQLVSEKGFQFHSSRNVYHSCGKKGRGNK